MPVEIYRTHGVFNTVRDKISYTEFRKPIFTLGGVYRDSSWTYEPGLWYWNSVGSHTVKTFI